MESTNVFSLDFRNWLKDVSSELNHQLVQIINNKFELQSHIYALKLFYLTGKGDFIQCLMEISKN